jgi:ribosomal protein L19E
LKKEKKETLAKIRAEWNEKLSQAKDKAEYRAIKSQYRTLYRQTKDEYNKKIAELRAMLRK